MNEKMQAEAPTTVGAGLLASNPWLPYVAPMAAYLLLTSAESFLPQGPEGSAHPTWYPVAYGVKAAVLLAVMWLCRSTWADLRIGPERRIDWVIAAVLGLAVAVVWVGAERLVEAAVSASGLALPSWLGGLSGRRMAFDPTVLSPGARIGFLGVRLVGLVLLVPVFEELFWRSFLMRFVIDPDDFRRIPIGRVTPLAVGVTSVGFAAAHPEWLPALVTGLAWAWLLGRSRSVGVCVLSHVVANMGLGAYVLTTGDYRFW